MGLQTGVYLISFLKERRFEAIHNYGNKIILSPNQQDDARFLTKRNSEVMNE